MLFACEDEECVAYDRRCTAEGVEECAITQCSVVSMHTSWTLIQRCEHDEMCTTEGCDSPDAGMRYAGSVSGEDCTIGAPRDQSPRR